MPTEIAPFIAAATQSLLQQDRSVATNHEHFGFSRITTVNPQFGFVDTFDANRADRAYPLVPAVSELNQLIASGKIRAQQISAEKRIIFETRKERSYRIKFTGQVVLSWAQIPEDEPQEVVIFDVTHNSARNDPELRAQLGDDALDHLFLERVTLRRQVIDRNIPFTTKADIGGTELLNH